MDSEVERFFPSASVNTTIVILRKQRNEDARNANTVRFIYFKMPLLDVIKENKGIAGVHYAITETEWNINTKFCIQNCIPQQKLSNFTKWGQFLKAPDIYFDILEKGKNQFVPLKNVALIKYGIKTGCNEFFILEDKTIASNNNSLIAAINNTENISSIKEVKERGLKLMQNGFNELWLIEKEFLEPILTSPKDVNNYTIIGSQKVNAKFILTNENKKALRTDFPYLFSYIRHGERLNLQFECCSLTD